MPSARPAEDGVAGESTPLGHAGNAAENLHAEQTEETSARGPAAALPVQPALRRPLSIGTAWARVQQAHDEHTAEDDDSASYRFRNELTFRFDPLHVTLWRMASSGPAACAGQTVLQRSQERLAWTRPARCHPGSLQNCMVTTLLDQVQRNITTVCRCQRLALLHVTFAFRLQTNASIWLPHQCCHAYRVSLRYATHATSCKPSHVGGK